MKLETKAKTLSKIKVKYAKVPKLIFFNVENFEKNEKEILAKIKKEFNSTVIIRSSTIFEDSKNRSFAGYFESIPNVDPKNSEDLLKKIKKVISSYRKFKNPKNEILIQEMIDKTTMSGVITTCDLKNKSPYYIINYHKGSDTSAITSGKENSENYVYFKKSPIKPQNLIFKKLILLAKELEIKFNNENLDIEFGVKKKKIFLFQVRHIKNSYNTKVNIDTYKLALKKLEKKIKKLKIKSNHLIGHTSFFGVMPDWNPAEIIGIKPKPLSTSLYRELITDHVWALNRKDLGFRDVTSNHLMTNFFGTPFIDIRVDFNSWIPRLLDDKLAKKLLNYYLNKFKKNTNVHDKIEFELLFTCFSLSTKEKLKKLEKYNFKKKEIAKISKSLKEINVKVFDQFNYYKKNIEILAKKQNQIINSQMYEIDKIYWLSEDCKRYGTYSFAGFARCGFIAMEILNSFVDEKIINRSDKARFLAGIQTITSEMLADKNNLTKEKFLKKYGHLRPDTYEISSENYRDGYSSYFKNQKKNKIIQKKNNFLFNSFQRKKIKNFLNQNKFDFNFYEFINFIKDSIKFREYSKYIFTKSIDHIFHLLKKLGKRLKINNSELSYLELNTITELYYNLDCEDLKIKFLKNIKNNKKIYEFNKKVILPEIICHPTDIYSFFEKSNKINFVGNKSVTLDLVKFSKKEIKNLKDKIVCIESADPGFDFIFNHEIGGLITKFGGANSHMSIRCAELGLPAAIGVGNVIFEKVCNAKSVYLNPVSNKLETI